MINVINEVFKRKKIVITLFLLLFGYGIYSYTVIPKQEMPEIDTPYMVLSITAPSMSASEIESDIVEDIEKVIMTFDDVVDVRTSVYDNFALLITTYSFSSEDPDSLSESIYEKVNELSLHESITDISYSSNFDDPHIIFTVHSASLNENELLSYSEEFKNELLLVEEINTVEIDSVFQKEVVITLDDPLLNTYGLTINDIYNIIYANTLNLPLGGIETAFGTISVTGQIDINDIEDLEELIIIPNIPSVTPMVQLKDLATIELKDTSSKLYEYNGENTVFLSVYFKRDVDFTKMGNDILDVKETFLEQENDSLLDIDEMLFLPDYVDKQISNVFISLLSAIVIVMIVVLFGIGFRNSLLVIITAPIILFGTIGILYISNFELHKLTIVGLIVAIGILVDNQIVITEGIKRNIDHGMKKSKAAKRAILDNMWPVLSSTLTTIAAFVVIVLLPGFLGEVVSSMPITVIIALSLSYIVSMSLSPILAIIFLKASKKEFKESIHERRIKSMIRKTIKLPYVWISISLLLLGGSTYIAFTTQPIDLYPNDERSVLYIDFEHESIGDLEQTKTISREIIDFLDDNDHVIDYSLSIGGDLPNFHFSSKFISELPHVGRLYVNFDYSEEDLLNYKTELEKELGIIPNTIITVNSLELSPPLAPVRLLLTSEDTMYLDLLATELYPAIEELEHVKSYSETTNVKSLKYNITYDFEAMSTSFITKAQIDGTISIHLNGYDLEIFEFNNEYINVQINSAISTYEDIYLLQVYSQQLDTNIPISSFITITEIYDYSVIERFNNQNANIIELYPTDDSDNIELEKDIKELIKDYDLSNVSITYTGENDLFKEIGADLIKASIIAVIFIFIIMFIQFNDFMKPFIILLTIPLSFSGSFLFLIIFNSPITATSLVGMVSLIGVTVNTGILLVEYISRRYTETNDIVKSCVESVYLRFRPIMLTSATTILGLIPLLITGGNFFRPMAITFIGGMITSTLLTIFLVPSIYYLLFNRRNKKRPVQ